MPKNVLFSLKNCKNRQTLGALSPDPLCLRRLGAPPPDPHINHLTYCEYCSLCICLQSTDSFGINQKTLFSCNYSWSAPGFRRRKIMLHFVCHRLRKLINCSHRFQFFSFCSSHSFFAGAALQSSLSSDRRINMEQNKQIHKCTDKSNISRFISLQKFATWKLKIKFLYLSHY